MSAGPLCAAGGEVLGWQQHAGLPIGRDGERKAVAKDAGMGRWPQVVTQPARC